MKNNNIIILGGDGFCGWPTALHLSKAGYDITIVDSLIRREIDTELGVMSLTPIADINSRIKAWKEKTGQIIHFEKLCIVNEAHRLRDVLIKTNPFAIVHFAEQRSAPYSMKSPKHKSFTITNNIVGTHNVLSALVEAGVNAHLVHLGTMGVYGYGDIDAEIPEGYLNVLVKKDDGLLIEKSIVYPANAGSIYHLTKTMDHQLFQFYQKNNSLRITELHQGIVWGTQTDETVLDGALINRFDYDGDFGTVLNRFLVQSSIGHPITVHGVGGQERAFIHIKDTVKCIKIAIENAPEMDERVKIFNQVAETQTVLSLAKKVVNLCGGTIEFVKNPRKELAENSLRVSNKAFLDLGLSPILIHDALMNEVNDVVSKFSSRVDLTKIPARSEW